MINKKKIVQPIIYQKSLILLKKENNIISSQENQN